MDRERPVFRGRYLTAVWWDRDFCTRPSACHLSTCTHRHWGRSTPPPSLKTPPPTTPRKSTRSSWWKAVRLPLVLRALSLSSKIRGGVADLSRLSSFWLSKWGEPRSYCVYRALHNRVTFVFVGPLLLRRGELLLPLLFQNDLTGCNVILFSFLFWKQMLSAFPSLFRPEASVTLNASWHSIIVWFFVYLIFFQSLHWNKTNTKNRNPLKSFQVAATAATAATAAKTLFH